MAVCLIGQQRRLGCNYVDVGIDAGLIPADFQLQVFLCGCHGIAFLHKLIGEDSHLRKEIFDLLEKR